MKIKNPGFKQSNISIFSLIGNDENSLAHSFAYFISKDINAYFLFIKHLLRIDIKKSKKHYKNVLIEVQKKRDEGITDIEISYKSEYHIVIECKIGTGKVKRQRTQYLSCFKEVKNKILVFLTQEKQTFLLPKEFTNNVTILNLTWLDVLGVYNSKNISMRELYDEFNKFIERGYKMTKLIKEILVQDVGDKEQIINFKENYLYRRPEPAGRPLYFAPHFTRNSGEEVGISYIAQILGVLTISPNSIKEVEDELKMFAEDDEQVNNELINRWKKGLDSERKDEVMTFYFLDKPFKFDKPILKEHRKEAKGWIGSFIPRNRTISFKTLLEHMK